MKSDFEERKAKRVEAYKRLAEKNSILSNILYKRAKCMAAVIPFGQPILIGHHSENRDRNYRNKIHSTYGKAFEASDKSNYYEEKAERLQNSNAISSDDPQAIQKLKAEVEKLVTLQEQMKAANKIIKSKKPEGQKLNDLKMMFPRSTDEDLKSLLEPDRLKRVGFPNYRLTNNNANINRIKKRIEQLAKLNQEKTTEEIIKDVKILDNVEDNRLQLYFPGKPSEEVRTVLKRNGFHWSPSQGCWQRFRSHYAKKEAIDIINYYC